ncbi:MAG: SDR family NAD(P)-dependent oxidoreductase, partial [Balneolaceae bacterium]
MKPVALVTGGSRGIGLAIAKQLCEAGYDMAINGMRSADKVQDIVEELSSTGTKVIYCQGDIGSTQDRAGILDQIRSSF